MVEVGEVVGVWGVKGWVKVRSHTRIREEILDFRTWFVGDETRPYALLDGRRQGAGIVARLEGVEDRDAAGLRVGRRIFVPADDLPEPETGEYYWADLEGLEVLNLDDERLGVVDHLIETGANDVLVVAGDKGEWLAPFVAGVVVEVDLDKGFMRLDWEADG